MKINRNFEMFGIKFHLNDNRIGISKCNYEYFPKYKLLVYDGVIGRWEQFACVNTKKEAKELIKRMYENGEYI